VVHYDLPWTAVRLDQRAGRAVRIGSRHAGVEIVTLLPPPVLESRLRQLARLARKRPLASRLGLGPAPEPVWQWRNCLGTRFHEAPQAGAAFLEGAPDADLVSVELHAGEELVSAFALARFENDAWSADHTMIAAILDRVHHARERPADPALVARVLAAAQRQVRAALLGASGALWRIRPLQGPLRAAFRRIQFYARDAIRRRDRSALALADRGIAFLRRGQTAGEGLLARRLAECAESDLEDLLAGMPKPDLAPPPLRARIVGVLLVRG
jgi:hypothetical protein